SLDPDDVFTDSLKILWYGRFHPGLNPRWTAVLVPIHLFFCLGIKCVLVSSSSDIFFTAGCLQTCILMIHVVFTLTKQILRYYFFQTVTSSIMFDVQPFMTGELPTVCYVPHGWFTFLTVVLWYLAWVVIMAFMGIDGLFCSFAISLMVQFRLLGHKFRNLVANQSKEDLSKQLRELVDYHNFLISCSQKLNDTFQIVFLIQFLISIASGSVSVFIFMQPGPWVNRMKCAIYFGFQIFETALYCIPVEFLINSARDVGDAVYESNWHELPAAEFKKCLTLVIAKSQKIFIFSGYGIVWINLRTFLLASLLTHTICKTIFTFYAYLNSAKKLSQ
ncbi:unnamed protein product, partial [Tenebrio molitor]